MTESSTSIEAFYHTATGSFAYLVYDARTRRAAAIDPVLDFDRRSGRVSTEAADEIVARVQALSLTVEWTLETHAHADHLSAGAYLKQRLGCHTAIGAGICVVQSMAVRLFGLGGELRTDGSQFDQLWHDGERFAVGELQCTVLGTPGHTPDSVTYLVGDAAFVGDTIFLPDVGSARCDFPGGSAAQLYASVQRLYRLPRDTRLLVGHDYPPQPRSPMYASDAPDQMSNNVHLHGGISSEQFVELRCARDRTLALPDLFFFALQVNVRAGMLPPVATDGRRYFRVPIGVADSWPLQGLSSQGDSPEWH